jgi:hypothetical protein
MLAAPGFLLAEVYHPLFGGEIDVPSIVAFQATPLQGLWPIVVLVIGAIEGYSSVSTFQDPTVALWAIKPGHIAGDLGLFGGANFAKTKPAEFKTMATKELNNGVSSGGEPAAIATDRAAARAGRRAGYGRGARRVRASSASARRVLPAVALRGAWSHVRAGSSPAHARRI